jgi:hypothetical protein
LSETISGSQSLENPVWSGTVDGRYNEERLVAIRADGFLILFTQREGGFTQTNIILFPYGQTTETNALGWQIVGRYK